MRRTMVFVMLVLAGCGAKTETATEPTTVTTPTTIAVSTTAPVDLVTADEIVAAVTAAGLPVPNPRDNTSRNCGTGPDVMHCTNLLTTDLFSVYEWATAEDAAHFLEVSGTDAVAVGPTTTVRFASGGSTPAYDRTAYEAVIIAVVP